MRRELPSFGDTMEAVWGRRWGVTSEIGTLRAVLMRRPGKEIDSITDPQAVYMREAIDGEKARSQHDALAEIYRKHGVEVHYVADMDESCPNGMYCRDLVLGCPEGVILTRPGIEVRLKEVPYAARAVSELGIPVLSTIHGNAVFDGACVVWVDRETVILGTGTRCNRAGKEQAEALFRSMGVKHVISLSIARNQNHLDGFLSIVDRDVAVTYPYITPDIVYEELERRGFRFVEIPAFEEKINFAANSVALEPGKIIMPSGAPRTVELLEKAGIEVIEVELDEIKKGGGAVHCLTAFLKRDDIPLYEIAE